jgi:hypothetical protein
MCQRLITLAYDEAGHHIAQCEHGTIHLLWVRASLFLHADMLLPLLSLLQCWHPRQAEAASQGFVLRRMDNGHTQLWYGCVGLLLRDVDVTTLCSLLWEAVQNLNLLDASPSRSYCRWTDEYRTLTVHPDDLETHN